MDKALNVSTIQNIHSTSAKRNADMFEATHRTILCVHTAREEKQKRYELDLVPPGVLLESEETESRCTVPILYKVRKCTSSLQSGTLPRISLTYIFSVFVAIPALCA